MIRVAYGGSFLLLRKIYKAYYERNSSSVGRALVNIPYQGSMVRIHSISLLFFLERRVHMSIEQLELILSDTYQMDVSFPMIFGHRKEFMRSSYSIWSVNELLEYVSSELYPKDNASIAEIEEIVRCFKSMMSKYYHMRQDTQLMFSIAINLAENVLDILRAME